MNNQFFFITTFDNISGSVLSKILNTHPDIDCKVSYSDPFLFSEQFWLTDPKIPALTQNKNDPSVLTLDQFIQMQSDSKKNFKGNAQYFTSYLLQHKTLIEKTKQPYRKANILLSPDLRINYLLHSWLSNKKTPDHVLNMIELQLSEMDKDRHSFFSLYIFHYFYNLLKEAIREENQVSLSHPTNHLFVIALAKVLAFDSADIPTPGKSFCFEKLIQSDASLIEFINYLTCDKIQLAADEKRDLASKRAAEKETLDHLSFATWEPWQTALLHRFIDKRLRTIYYPHINKPLSAFYAEAGYNKFSSQQNTTYSKLISIQLNSNRPAQLAAYFDNVEESADNPEDIEVLVNIDIGNASMKYLLDNEKGKRKFTLKYIETPRPKSFCDLWMPINNLLDITDPNAYFLLNISDEMFFATPGWDTILKKYVGFYPDNLFRLRASRNKFRNYFDRWECSFAQDAIPITTKRWIDIGGNWNPCFGPDSFQQLISYYLSKEGMFTNEHMLRDLPIIDIKFSGDVPALGIDPEKSWKHNKDHIKAMQICQSYEMQLEARRRANLIRANMVAYENQLENYSVVDARPIKQIQLIDQKTNTVIGKYDYRVSSLSIGLTNQFRKLYFFCYFGGGINTKVNIIKSFAAYLRSSSLFYKHVFARLSIIKNAHKYPFKQFIKKLIGRDNRHTLTALNHNYERVLQLCAALRIENEKLSNKINHQLHNSPSQHEPHDEVQG